MLPVTSAPGGAGAAVAETKSKQRCMFFWIAVIVACTIVFLVKPLKHVPEMPFTSGTGGRSSTAAAACRNQVISESYSGAYVVTAAHAKNFAQVEQLVRAPPFACVLLHRALAHPWVDVQLACVVVV